MLGPRPIVSPVGTHTLSTEQHPKNPPMTMPQGLSITSHLALMKAGRARADQLVVVPPPVMPPQPYEVRIREGVGGTVMLVGYDGRSEPFSEWRVPRSKVSPRMVERFSRWCRENDDGPALQLVPGDG